MVCLSFNEIDQEMEHLHQKEEEKRKVQISLFIMYVNVSVWRGEAKLEKKQRRSKKNWLV